MSRSTQTYWRRYIFRPPVEFVQGLRATHEKKVKGGINQGPWDTASIYNQFTSKLLHNVIYAMK